MHTVSEYVTESKLEGKDKVHRIHRQVSQHNFTVFQFLCVEILTH